MLLDIGTINAYIKDASDKYGLNKDIRERINDPSLDQIILELSVGFYMASTSDIIF